MSIYFAYLYGLLTLIGLEFSLFKPTFFIWLTPIIILTNIFFIWLAVRSKFSINFWNFLISPFLFLVGGIIFISFSDNWLIKHLSVLFLTLGNTIFIYWLIIHSYHKYKYKKHSLSNISRVINISTIFFWFTNFSNFNAFLRLPTWNLILLSTIISYFVIYQFFSINKIKWSATKIFVLILTGIIIEFFYVLTWLPLLSMVKAILITSIYYFLTGLAKHYLESTLAKTVYLRYSLITAFIWLIILLTARWE